MTSQTPAGDNLAIITYPAPSDAPLEPGTDSRPTGDHGPSDEMGAGVQVPDLPLISDEERERNREGLRQVIAEYEAEHGAFTEEERAQARARLSSVQ